MQRNVKGWSNALQSSSLSSFIQTGGMTTNCNRPTIFNAAACEPALLCKVQKFKRLYEMSLMHSEQLVVLCAWRTCSKSLGYSDSNLHSNWINRSRKIRVASKKYKKLLIRKYITIKIRHQIKQQYSVTQQEALFNLSIVFTAVNRFSAMHFCVYRAHRFLENDKLTVPQNYVLYSRTVNCSIV